jgi:hypothetical protein
MYMSRDKEAEIRYVKAQRRDCGEGMTVNDEADEAVKVFF